LERTRSFQRVIDGVALRTANQVTAKKMIKMIREIKAPAKKKLWSTK